MKLQPLNKQLADIDVSEIRQFDESVSKIPGILKLTLGEPDFNKPEHVKQAGIEAIQENYSHYTGMVGDPELREAAQHFSKQNMILITLLMMKFLSPWALPRLWQLPLQPSAIQVMPCWCRHRFIRGTSLCLR